MNKILGKIFKKNKLGKVFSNKNKGVRIMVFNNRQWEYLRKCWHLTPREIEVAKLLCKDLDNDRIADKLNIAYNTVRSHLGNVFRKMGVRGKASVILEFINVLRKAKI